jgi:hypothetical protein
MSDIYLKYSGTSGFSRSNNKTGFSGKVLSYADFKVASGDIIPGSADQYGIIMDSADITDFIANYEIDSIFTEAELQ